MENLDRLANFKAKSMQRNGKAVFEAVREAMARIYEREPTKDGMFRSGSIILYAATISKS